MLRTRRWMWTWSIVRLVAAALAIAAIVAQLQRTVENALAAATEHGGHLPTIVANFFSFFTIQSNLAAAVTLLLGGILAWTRRRADATDPRWFAVLLACATTYMIVTGVVYNTLLRGIELPQGETVGWSNEVLHVVIPIVMALDLLVGPGRRALRWRAAWVVVAYPIVWVAYTFVRAPLVVSPATGQQFWYPYPFLNPHAPGGWPEVIFWVAVIAITITVVGLAVVWVGRARARAGAPGADARHVAPATGRMT